MDPSLQVAGDSVCPGLGTTLSAAGLIVSVANSSDSDDDNEN